MLIRVRVFIWVAVVVVAWLSSKSMGGVGARAAPPVSLPGCQTKCGNLTIPYPFGIGQGCYAPGFEIKCDVHTKLPVAFFHPSPSSFLTGSPLPRAGGGGEVQAAAIGGKEVLGIHLEAGQLLVNQFLAYDCYSAEGRMRSYNTSARSLVGLPYTFSDTRNKFVAVGCDTVGFLQLQDENVNNVTIGCVSICDSLGSVKNGSCSGVGCCEAPIPKGLTSFSIYLDSYRNHTNCLDFDPCSYGFLIDQDSFNFTTRSFVSLGDVNHIPVTLDWAVSSKTCMEARKNSSGFACVAGNSECIDSANGYRCVCSSGFRGNPYLNDGCLDIDECKTERKNPCVKRCKNLPGSFSCYCPRGMFGDGKTNGSGCRSIFPYLGFVLGGVVGVGVVVGFLFPYAYAAIQSRKRRSLRLKNFYKNHGLLLEKLVSSGDASSERTRIFSLEELEKATNSFDDTRILGQGGHGTVYKGILSDQRIVAIKKSKLAVQLEIDQFINEVVILSQISHRNIVKLYGCCLETPVPLLVYEFISNGTLSDYLHARGDDGKNHPLWLTWDDRLRIATETAGALAYLHSAASISIFHRDVKTSNILLDDNCTVRVSDFGASRSIPMYQTRIMTMVQGTIGYLDPEYFHTHQLTHKSDVYSFGVILVELLTGQKPAVCFPIFDGVERNLITHFLRCLRDDQLFEAVEPDMMNVDACEEIRMVAMLAENCLKLCGDDRPSMKEVEQKLLGLRSYRKHLEQEQQQKEKENGEEEEHQWLNQVDNQERSGLLLQELQANNGDHGSRQFSLEKKLMMSMRTAR